MHSHTSARNQGGRGHLLVCILTHHTYTLQSLGHAVVEEWVDEKSGVSIDILLPEANIAVEVDGPSHYASNGRSPLGSTVV